MYNDLYQGACATHCCPTFGLVTSVKMKGDPLFCQSTGLLFVFLWLRADMSYCNIYLL